MCDLYNLAIMIRSANGQAAGQVSDARIRQGGTREQTTINFEHKIIRRAGGKW